MVLPEGNTRTTAVFLIKYLRTLGFDATNDIFAENAWYFRNALVRANYNDLKAGIHETTEFLELFLKNLLLNERNPLHNRSMHISGIFDDFQNQDIKTLKQDIEFLKNEGRKQEITTQEPDIDIQREEIMAQKPDIETRKEGIEAEKQYIEAQKEGIKAKKQDINAKKQDIEILNQDIAIIDLYSAELQKAKFSKKTLEHIQRLYEKFGCNKVFGRAEVVSELGITESPASELIRKLLGIEIILPVRGKGKYVFRTGRYHHTL